MKKMYDILIQCGICNGEVDHFQSGEKAEVGQETIRGVCHRCGQEDEYGVITVVEVDRIIDDPEEIEELFPDLDGVGVEVESVTAWAVPTSQYPKRDWLTVKEAADQLGISKDTLWTKIKRGWFHKYQAAGYIQSAGSVTLVHRKIIESIQEEKEK
ncbi:helix-turn-helix domain-containing protein [Thermoactinomyces sp. CICC 10521]|uniref:helix-turn-helix domain-containing protein n=1 Tax=Thermoactinomyces sp. CICC 10521 TaxID=2767426 RepID=UPI0018DB6589|nr:helix-turn-helix domain-containing protein [Thermoactinomyces sp. CICC 10521]MBH8608927.1 helix-turn-helix domain-containing protein [Thermoactinomyces sp. CICC 10521]